MEKFLLTFFLTVLILNANPFTEAGICEEIDQAIDPCNPYVTIPPEARRPSRACCQGVAKLPGLAYTPYVTCLCFQVLEAQFPNAFIHERLNNLPNTCKLDSQPIC